MMKAKKMANKNIAAFLTRSLAIITLAITAGCVLSAPGQTQNQTTDSTIDAINDSSIDETIESDRELIILSGELIQKPWSKTVESWMAGGGDYYVLQLDEESLTESEDDPSPILRGSDEVPWESFTDYQGLRVEVEGEFIEPEPYEPSSPLEQYPIDIEGRPLPRGGGFKVYSIREID